MWLSLRTPFVPGTLGVMGTQKSAPRVSTRLQNAVYNSHEHIPKAFRPSRCDEHCTPDAELTHSKTGNILSGVPSAYQAGSPLLRRRTPWRRIWHTLDIRPASCARLSTAGIPDSTSREGSGNGISCGVTQVRTGGVLPSLYPLMLCGHTATRRR